MPTHSKLALGQGTLTLENLRIFCKGASEQQLVEQAGAQAGAWEWLQVADSVECVRAPGPGGCKLRVLQVASLAEGGH